MKRFFIYFVLISAMLVFYTGCKKDTNPPVITIIGANPLNHPLGTPYDDPGATAFDEEDGDITDQITTIIDVDVNVEGYNYSVTYTVEDKAGNQAEPAVRAVHVLQF